MHDSIVLENCTFPNGLTNAMSLDELNDPDAIEEVTVNGKDGIIHINEEEARIVWLVNDYCYVSITSTAPVTGNLLTRQELLDLAATVSQDAPPPVVETE